MKDQNPEPPKNKTSISSEIETRFLQSILNCSLFFQREINKILLTFKLNYQQLCVLNEIIWNGPVSQKELCEKLLFEKSNISKIIKKLLKKGLVQMTVDPIDRRLTLLSEAPEGISVWKDSMQALNEFSVQFSSVLAPEEITYVIRQLKILQTAVKKKERNQKMS